MSNAHPHLHTPASKLTFETIHEISKSVGETNDCTVKATAVVTHLSYFDAHALLRKAGRRNRCGLEHWRYMPAIQSLGFEVIDVTRDYEATLYSTRTLAPKLPDTRNYMIHTRKHVAAVTSGMVLDWSEHRKLYVEDVWLVRGPNDAPYVPREPRARRIVVTGEQPTKAVHLIADALFEEEEAPNLVGKRWLGAFRGKVVAECELNGINPITASVQCGKWFKAKRGW